MRRESMRKLLALTQANATVGTFADRADYRSFHTPARGIHPPASGTRSKARGGRAHRAALVAQPTVQQDFFARIIEQSRVGIRSHAGTRRSAPTETRFHQHGMAKCLFPRLCRLHADTGIS